MLLFRLEKVGIATHLGCPNKKVIIDTDPIHPEPLDISSYDSMNKTLRVFLVSTLAYEIILRPLKYWCAPTV